VFLAMVNQIFGDWCVEDLNKVRLSFLFFIYNIFQLQNLSAHMLILLFRLIFHAVFDMLMLLKFGSRSHTGRVKKSCVQGQADSSYFEEMTS